jgi:hypothetical protein
MLELKRIKENNLTFETYENQVILNKIKNLLKKIY